MATDPSNEEVAHILGSDIASFSLKTIEAQIECVQRFHSLLTEVLEMSNPRPVILDTGDGANFVFSGSLANALKAAEFLGSRARELGLDLRLGMHSGPVTKLEDANGRMNVYGPGVNLAHRVMNAAAPGGLLVSATSAEFAQTYEAWRDRLVDLGTVPIKHGQRLGVFSVVGFGGIRPETAPNPGKNHNLPREEHAAIGRESEKTRLAHLILDERRKLITIAGPGGIGKTCLATMMGWFLVPDFADGVWFVECDGLTGEEVEAKLASVLKLAGSYRESESVQQHLAEKQCLVILDCLERTTGVVQRIESWFQAAPDVQVLATSRVVLASKWESEFFIGPLRTKRGEDGTVDAQTLFVDVVRQFDPAFMVNRSNHATIDAIVGELQGVPLSIILAAGRLKYMTLTELRERLAGRKIDVLKRHRPTGDKHADLSQVVAESFELLDAQVRNVMAGLSVFSGGFYLADAQSVLAGVPDVLDSIEVLRDNSLLSPTMVGKHMRYRCLDVVSEYLETIPNDNDILARAHAEHFSQVAKRARGVFDKGNWSAESELFWDDLGNYRRAISFAIKTDWTDLIHSFARSLARIFMEAGLRADFEQLALRAEPSADDALCLELQGLLGGIYRREDNRELAELYWLRRAETLAEGGDLAAQADSWADLATMALHYDDDVAAKRYLDRYWQATARLPKTRETALGYVADGKWLLRQGDEAAARVRSLESEQILGLAPMSLRSLSTYAYLAELCDELGDHGRALQLCISALPVAINGRQTSSAGQLLLTASASLVSQGDLDHGLRALALAERIPKSVSKTLGTRLKRVKLKVDEALKSGTGSRRVEPQIVNWSTDAVILAQEIEASLRGNAKA